MNKLTVTELNVLFYLRKGCNISAISKNLNITQHTIKALLTRILKKYNVKSRKELLKCI